MKGMLKRKINGNSIGMFDFIKGIAMIDIVMAHVWWNVVKYYPGTERYPWWIRIIGKTNACVLAVLFIASGYMFREMTMKKGIQKQVSQLLYPYILSSISSVVLMAVWFAVSGEPEWKSRLLTLAGGLLFGLRQAGTWFGISVGGIQALWFVLALFNSSILLQMILKLKDEKKIAAVLVCCTLAGMLMRFVPVQIPWCIPQALCFTVFLYVGYYWKKHKILFRDYHPMVYVGCLAGYCILAVLGQADAVVNYWKLWLLEIPTLIMGAFLAIELCFFLFDNKAAWMQPIIIIGRYSYWVMCVHAVDCLVTEWHQVFGQWFSNRYEEYFFMLAWRGFVVFAGCWVIKSIKRIKSEREEKVSRA